MSRALMRLRPSRRGGEHTLTIAGDRLIPQMLPILFTTGQPHLIVTQGEVGRWVVPMTWSET